MTKSQWLSLNPGDVIKSKTSGCTEVVLKANLPTFRLRNRGGNALNRKMWTLVKRKAARKKHSCGASIRRMRGLLEHEGGGGWLLKKGRKK